MKSLGNKFIETGTGPRIQIADPKAAEELLDLAIELRRSKQRLLFFCSCQWPRCGGKINCHRATVAGLVLRAARRRGIAIDISEWPGRSPKRIKLEMKTEDFASIKRGRMTIPLGKQPDLSVMAALPWGSIATLSSNGESLHRVVGPANHEGAQWALPVLCLYHDPATELGEYARESVSIRRALGLEPKRS
jgi:hypothetical protein